jgi:hypothetical protein
MNEYSDAKKLMNIRQDMIKYGEINIFQHFQFEALKKKYGLIDFNLYQF